MDQYARQAHFNSTIVRLKGMYPGRRRGYISFQFYDSTIKSAFATGDRLAGVKFQFYDSTIKSVLGCGEIAHTKISILR